MSIGNTIKKWLWTTLPKPKPVVVKVKKTHPDAVMPKFGKSGDAGADLVAVDVKYNPEGDFMEYNLGLAFAVPAGYGLFLYPRSSQSNKTQLLSNHVGVVDSGFRGTVTVRFKDIGKGWLGTRYAVGDRVVQAVLHKLEDTRYEEVTELDETERGNGGYGSTGK